MEAALIVVSALLAIAIAGLAVSNVLLSRNLSSTKDRAVLADSIRSLVDCVVTGHEDQLNRMNIEKEVELGREYLEAQERIESRRRFHNNGAAQTAKPDVSVPMDDE